MLQSLLYFSEEIVTFVRNKTSTMNSKYGMIGLIFIGICMIVAVNIFKSFDRSVSVKGLCRFVGLIFFCISSVVILLFECQIVKQSV